jgi:GNAT superfamily N-acetyltransferase
MHMQLERRYPVIHKTTRRLTPFTPAHIDDVIRIWNAAVHPDYPLNERFLRYNLSPGTGEVIEGRVAIHHREAVGFVLVCALVDDPASTLGWIGALAVEPSAQRKGIGSELLTWAESWLKEQGCKRVRLGGNLRPFSPGLPYVLRENAAFFEQHGYQSPPGQPYEYDIARSLKDYRQVYSKPVDVDLDPMQPGEESLLLDFLHQEYPGRWEFEAREFLRNGGRASDYLLLRVQEKVQGFCRLTLPDSERPLERFYPQRLPQPWGQFGPLGLSKAIRGQGLGGYLIDAAALHMQSLGVDGCVIDWTSLVDLYGKFGFRIYNQYLSLFKIFKEH